MQLSKKSRYGLRALIDLASAPQNQYVSLSNIAERGEIPAQFLEQVFASFRRAGLVKALKGPREVISLPGVPNTLQQRRSWRSWRVLIR